MSEELQKVIDNNLEWYKNLQYEDAKVFIKDNINSASRSFVAIGYYLKYIRDHQMYTQDGYESIWELAQAEFGISKSQASKFMSINDRFSKDGNSPILLDQYKDFSSSKLSEMLYLTDEQLEQVTVGTTVAQIREIKKPEKKNACVIKNDLADTDLKCSGLEGNADCIKCDKAEAVSTSKQEPEAKPSYLKCAAYDFSKSGKRCSGCFYDKPENNCPYDRTGYFENMTNIPEPVNDPPKTVDKEPEIVNDANESDLPCDTCGHDINRCCGYDTKDDYCVGGDKWVPKQELVETVEADIVQTEQEYNFDMVSYYNMSDIKYAIKKHQQDIASYIDCKLDAPIVKKTKMELDALELLEEELYMRSMQELIKKPEPVQPELPIMKNNEQRKAFIEAYESWPIWIDNKDTGERYYRYNFDNGDSFVIKVYWCEYYHYDFELRKYVNEERYTHREEYILKPGKHFKNCQTNTTALVDYLKNLQKKGA